MSLPKPDREIPLERFGLALSGGGFRATLFHLGGVRFLYEAGLLGRVSHISSVSGGSILAAHLVLKWQQYNGNDFDDASAQLVEFVRADVRNRIVRRLPLTFLAHLFGKVVRRADQWKLTRNGLLERSYERQLYGGTCVRELEGKGPHLLILTTNVTEGCLCAFVPNGLLFFRRRDANDFVQHVRARLSTLSLAVTASSAFPGFFPTVRISNADIGAEAADYTTQWFTDGGVYDNLGVRVFQWLREHCATREDCVNLCGDESIPTNILVSDAGQRFRIATDPRFMWLFGTAVRAADIMFDRVGQLERISAKDDQGFIFASISDTVERDGQSTFDDPAVQARLSHIRTDFDRFSDVEISALVRHGYSVFRNACRSAPEVFGTTFPEGSAWNPLRQKRKQTRIAKATNDNRGSAAMTELPPSRLARLRHTLQKLTSQMKVARVPVASADTLRARELIRSAERRVWSGFLDIRDWPTWVVYVPLVILIAVSAREMWKAHQMAQMDAAVVEAIALGNDDFQNVRELLHAGVRPLWTSQADSVDELKALTADDYEGFEIIKDVRIIDLRAWKAVASTNRNDRSPAVWIRRTRLRRKPDSENNDSFRIQHRTTGDGIEVRSTTERFPARARRAERPDTVGGRQTHVWEVEIDLRRAAKGVTIDLVTEAIYWNGFQGSPEEWAAMRIDTTIGLAGMWILFPEGKPYQNYRLLGYETGNKMMTEIPVEPVHEINHPKNAIIGWSVGSPKSGYTYECRWLW
ncbi:MAG: patatin-like phospholipase family protein [Planctomycetia bacterium]|nr:patatin-like phospholipase family protein [Planctomycetia bacterium]